MKKEKYIKKYLEKTDKLKRRKSLLAELHKFKSTEESKDSKENEGVNINKKNRKNRKIRNK